MRRSHIDRDGMHKVARMSLPPLAPSWRRADQVFEALRTAILGGALTPGTRLRIREVAEDLGTSVMPVRDAIARLEEARLVESTPYRGAVVRTFTPGEMLDVYAVRRLLEVEAARRGTMESSSELAAAMERAFERVRAAVEAEAHVAFLDADEAFLIALYERAGNPALLDTIQGLWRRSRSYKLFGVAGPWSPRVHLAYQPGLIRAVRSGDGEAAGVVIARSIDDATERIRAELVGAGT